MFLYLLSRTRDKYDVLVPWLTIDVLGTWIHRYLSLLTGMVLCCLLTQPISLFFVVDARWGEWMRAGDLAFRTRELFR